MALRYSFNNRLRTTVTMDSMSSFVPFGAASYRTMK